MTIRERGTLAAAILGSGIVFLDSTVVHVALPAIGRELPSGFFDPFAVQNLVYYAYLLTLSSLLIMAGGLSDNFGRRRMYLWGLIGFGATSILCAAAWSSEALIIARALQGAAGALLIPGSLAIITAAFDTEKQGRAFGIWASASAATTMLGPFIGGMLVDSISWRLVFWINVPIIAIAVWTTIRWVQDTETNSKGRLDPLGSVLAFLAIGGLSVGAIVGEQLQWRGPVPIIALTIGVLASIAFPIAMKRVTRPLIPPTLFRSRNFTVVNVSTFLIYGALYVMFALVVIFVQGTLGYNAAAAGLVAFPTTLILTLFSSKFGEISGKRGPRLFLTAGPILMGIGVLWLTRIPADSQAWIFGSGNESTIMPPASYLQDLLPAFLVFGTGLAMLVAPLTQALMASIPKENAGVGSAVNNAISRVGPQLAGAAIFIVIAGTFYSSIERQVPEIAIQAEGFREQVSPLNAPPDSLPAPILAATKTASAEAFHLGMFIAAGLLFAGAAVNGIWLSKPSPEAAESDPGDCVSLRFCAEPARSQVLASGEVT